MPDSYPELPRIIPVIEANLYCLLVSPSNAVQGTGSANLISPFSLRANYSYDIVRGIEYTFRNSCYRRTEVGSLSCTSWMIDSCFI